MPQSLSHKQTPETLVLLSYDVSAINRSAASHVTHLIFGRKDAGRDSPTPYIHRPEVVWIGQSVFVMPRSIATELAAKLRGLGAFVAMAQVSMAFREIEAFRRRASQRCVP